MALVTRLLSKSHPGVFLNKQCFSFLSSSPHPKRILARASKHQIVNPKVGTPHPRTSRLLKRIILKEESLRFQYDSDFHTDVLPNLEFDEVVNTSSSLMRLYSEAGRPRQENLQLMNGWDHATVADRTDKFWNHIYHCVDWEKGRPPPRLHEEKLKALLYCSRADTPELLESVIEKLTTENLDMSLYDHIVAKSLSCKGLENGIHMFEVAIKSGAAERTDEGMESFLCQVARHLGESCTDFKLLIKLCETSDISLTPSMYVSWLEGLRDRRGEQGPHFDSAYKYTKQDALLGFEKTTEVRCALIRVAMHDRSSRAVAKAFSLLDDMCCDHQTPSLPCLNALASWCANHRPPRSSLNYSSTHSRLQAIEKAMVKGKVRPTPRILGNLLAGYGAAGDAMSALGIYRNMHQRGIYLNGSDYAMLLNAISNGAIPTPNAWRLLADPSNLVQGLLKEIQEVGVTVDVHILNEALRIFTSTLRVAKHLNNRAASFEADRVDFDHIVNSAAQLFQTAIEGTASTPSVLPNKTTYTNMIKIYCLSGNLESAIGMLDTMKQDVMVDVEVYNYIFEYLSAKDWREAEDLLIVMTNQKIHPNANTMNAFLKGYSKSNNLATGFSMVQACFNQYGVRPSKSIFLSALETVLKNEDIYEAKRIGFIYRQLWPDDEEVLQEYMKGAEGAPKEQPPPPPFAIS